MNHDLAAVLDYLDQRFGTNDRQAFEQRLDQEPQLRELLEKTKTMQRNLRSIFGQSERLAAPNHNIKRLTKLSTYRHTLNALLIVVVLLGGMYLVKRTNAYPTPNHDMLALTMADHAPDTPEQQLLLIKGVDREQNHFVRAMHDAQQMWQANNVEALIIANNGDRFELSKQSSHYLLSRKSSDEQPIWQQSLPYEPDSSTILGLYSSPDQAELYLSAYAPSQANQTANFNQALNIIPKQQLNSQQSFAYAVPVESNPNSIYDVLNSVTGSSGELPLPIGPITGTVDAMQGSQQGQESFGRVIELKQQHLIIDANSGAIKPATSECTCRYLESNTILYRYDQGLPFSDYLDYEISPANPNLLTLLTADQQVLTYDLQQHKTINSTKLELEPQLNQNLHRSMQFGMFGLDSSDRPNLSTMTDVQISGNQQMIIIRDSDAYSTSFYAFDRQSGKQIWQKSLLQPIDSFTTNWDGSMVYAIDASPSPAQSQSTLYTISATAIGLTNYEQQQLEEIHMIYDF